MPAWGTFETKKAEAKPSAQLSGDQQWRNSVSSKLDALLLLNGAGVGNLPKPMKRTKKKRTMKKRTKKKRTKKKRTKKKRTKKNTNSKSNGSK